MRVSVKWLVGLKRERKGKFRQSELNIHSWKPTVAEWCRESNRIFKTSSEKDSQWVWRESEASSSHPVFWFQAGGLCPRFWTSDQIFGISGICPHFMRTDFSSQALQTDRSKASVVLFSICFAPTFSDDLKSRYYKSIKKNIKSLENTQKMSNYSAFLAWKLLTIAKQENNTET